jgi:hypothetical protein
VRSLFLELGNLIAEIRERIDASGGGHGNSLNANSDRANFPVLAE